jgi:hypothetical protein
MFTFRNPGAELWRPQQIVCRKNFIFTELQPCDLPDFVTLAKAAHAHPVTICHHPNAGIQILMKAEALNSEGARANVRPVEKSPKKGERR